MVAGALALALLAAAGCTSSPSHRGPVLVGPTLPANPTLFPAPSIPAIVHRGARWPIRHVVFLVKENHTFDNLFGRFPGADGATTAVPRRAGPSRSRSRPTITDTTSRTSGPAPRPPTTAAAWTGSTG